MRRRSLFIIAVAIIAVGLGPPSNLTAQVGKGTIADVNTAVEKDLLSMPHMTPAIVKGLIEQRPFANVVELTST